MNRSLLREPLVHFLGIAVVLFGLQLVLGQTAPEDDDPLLITVDRALEADVERQLTEELGRVPDPAELSEAVDRWVDTEILVREARALGLDRDDPIIRARLAEKMVYVTRAVAVPPDPPDAELRALYEESPDDFLLETELTIRQLFATGPDGRARAQDLADRWRAGADHRELVGDEPPGGAVLTSRTPEQLADLFGEHFASRVGGQGEEIAVVESNAGWHAVQVERVREGRQLGFEEARERLTLRWRARWIEAATNEAVEARRGQYRVHR